MQKWQPGAICLLLITIITSAAFDCCCHLSPEGSTEAAHVCLLFQVLKGGHEAPTKPKGRPKKNSIPTTEEIEAEERRLKLEEEERMRRAAEEAALGAEASQLEPQDLSTVSTVTTESHDPAAVMESSERELPLPETHAVS